MYLYCTGYMYVNVTVILVESQAGVPSTRSEKLHFMWDLLTYIRLHICFELYMYIGANIFTLYAKILGLS